MLWRPGTVPGRHCFSYLAAMKTRFHIVPFLLLCLLLTFGCKNSSNGGSGTPEPSTEEKLVKQYENGQVEKCDYQDGFVYKCTMNAHDAGDIIYNEKGEKIGQCIYATNIVDPICKELQRCQTVYRVADNIWGKPAFPYKAQ